jgi:Tol biopolymer transport system component
MGVRMQLVLRHVRLVVPIAAGLSAGLGCGGADIGSPTGGNLQVTTATSGPNPDADGYVITIDDGGQTVIGTNATLQRENIEPGAHSVQLAGVSPNCAVAGDNPRSVEVVAGQTVTVEFTITCTALTGAIRVTVTTSGSPTDPDGYTVVLDGADPGLPVETTGEVTFPDVPAGTHTVALTGTAANCTVAEGASRGVTVAAGETAEVGLTVTCAEPAASIELTTATTGFSLDPDGYAVSLDGGAAQPIGVNATLSLPGLSPGSHTVTLSGIAANCHLDGENPRTVEVVAGPTPVTFQLDCLGANALVAFTTNAADLLAVLVVNPDGSGLRNLTPPGTFESNPIWSPDGRKLLVLGDGDLYVMDADGSGRERLVDGQEISEHRWSPDGRMIAFVDLRIDGGDAVDDLWVMQADGSGMSRLVKGAFNFSWSPDGRIVYTSVADFADVHLRVVNTDGSGDVRLTSQAAFQPAWSPDGGRIAFVTLEDHDVVLVDPDGANELNLTGGVSEDETPAWSPDGSRIVFTLGPLDQSLNEAEIAVMNRDGSGRVTLTNHPGFDFQPAWSPDGSRIVFTRADGGDTEIFVMNADGSGQANVSNRPETLEDTPDWNGQAPPVTVASRPAAFYQRWLRANGRSHERAGQPTRGSEHR